MCQQSTILHVNIFSRPQLHPGILCMPDVFLWHMICMALSLELNGTYYIWVLSNHLSISWSSLSYFYLVTPCFVVAVLLWVELIPVKKKSWQQHCNTNCLFLRFWNQRILFDWIWHRLPYFRCQQDKIFTAKLNCIIAVLSIF